jgi:hypothetical protein
MKPSDSPVHDCINENHETLAKEDVDFQEMDYSYDGVKLNHLPWDILYPIRQNLLTAGHSYLIRVVAPNYAT